MPSGEILVEGDGNGEWVNAFYVVTPDGEILLLSGNALTQSRGFITQFVDFPGVEEVEEEFNYATGYIHPQYQKEIRGGRAAEVAKVTLENYFSRRGIKEAGVLDFTRIVSASDYRSKDKIRGNPNFADRIITASSFTSKDKVRGRGNFDSRNVLKTDFDSKKKVKGKRDGRDGEYNYEDEMFKR